MSWCSIYSKIVMADCVRSFLFGTCTKQNVYHSKTLGIKITLLVLLHPLENWNSNFPEEILIEFKTEISFKNNWNYFNGMPNEPIKIWARGCFAISHTCFWTPSQTCQFNCSSSLGQSKSTNVIAYLVTVKKSYTKLYVLHNSHIFVICKKLFDFRHSKHILSVYVCLSEVTFWPQSWEPCKGKVGNKN